MQKLEMRRSARIAAMQRGTLPPALPSRRRKRQSTQKTRVKRAKKPKKTTGKKPKRTTGKKLKRTTGKKSKAERLKAELEECKNKRLGCEHNRGRHYEFCLSAVMGSSWGAVTPSLLKALEFTGLPIVLVHLIAGYALEFFGNELKFTTCAKLLWRFVRRRDQYESLYHARFYDFPIRERLPGCRLIDSVLLFFFNSTRTIAFYWILERRCDKTHVTGVSLRGAAIIGEECEQLDYFHSWHGHYIEGSTNGSLLYYPQPKFSTNDFLDNATKFILEHKLHVLLAQDEIAYCPQEQKGNCKNKVSYLDNCLQTLTKMRLINDSD